jgi:small subunit ribosomal protein S2
MEEKNNPPAAKASKGEKKNKFNINVEEMAELGLHFGHRKSKTNPKMKPYLYGVRNGIHIFDLEKTKEKLEEALEFIAELISKDKTLLIIGTKIQSKVLVKDLAKECGFPYVDERWLGGTFTNFNVIKKRIIYFKDLDSKRASGELEKYTKKERIKIDKDLEKFEKKFGGIKYLESLPDAVLILDIEKDAIALKEAKERGITIVAVSDSNTDPGLVDYPIPANDDAISAVKYILEKVREVTLKAKEHPKKEEQKTSAPDASGIGAGQAEAKEQEIDKK